MRKWESGHQGDREIGARIIKYRKPEIQKA
jgi:hypothetical protein